MDKPLSKDELEDKLCDYCPCTEYGWQRINTGPWNSCENINCDEAYQNYLDEFEGEM